MKLISTEIDEAMIQLTYTDGDPESAGAQLLVLRAPLQGPLKRPVLWHHLMAVRHIETFVGEEARRLRDELEKMD
ncbi:MAG: hypothetical protein LH485_04860 [Sphingomonas bacterium]|nr:hypothetical protein [Sphingomonas bacterium]